MLKRFLVALAGLLVVFLVLVALKQTKIEYVKPFVMDQVGELSLRPEGAATRVTWSVRGVNGFLARLMCSFVNMDRMVGGTFEKGLQNLKARMEKL